MRQQSTPLYFISVDPDCHTHDRQHEPTDYMHIGTLMTLSTAAISDCRKNCHTSHHAQDAYVCNTNTGFTHTMERNALSQLPCFRDTQNHTVNNANVDLSVNQQQSDDNNKSSPLHDTVHCWIVHLEQLHS